MTTNLKWQISHLLQCYDNQMMIIANIWIKDIFVIMWCIYGEFRPRQNNSRCHQ